MAQKTAMNKGQISWTKRSECHLQCTEPRMLSVSQSVYLVSPGNPGEFQSKGKIVGNIIPLILKQQMLHNLKKQNIQQSSGDYLHIHFTEYLETRRSHCSEQSHSEMSKDLLLSVFLDQNRRNLDKTQPNTMDGTTEFVQLYFLLVIPGCVADKLVILTTE